MRTCKFAAVLTVLLCVIAIVPLAWADPMPITLFNTGVGTGGNLVPDGGVDPHYTLSTSPDPLFPGPSAYAGHIGALWTANTSISKWIGPDPSFEWVASGDYVYHTTFELPNSFDPKKDTASITGWWSSDNTGVDILINGKSTGNFIPFGEWGVSDSWRTLHPLSITTGFEKGDNTLDFVVWNEGAYSGLHVQMTGFYDLKPIPEPSTLGLVGIGILGLFGYGWGRGRHGWQDPVPM